MTEGKIATPPFGRLAMTNFSSRKEIVRLPFGKPQIYEYRFSMARFLPLY
jgi:hypothetical protein